MRKLFIILVCFIAVVTFIRAMDNFSNVNAGTAQAISGSNSEIILK